MVAGHNERVFMKLSTSSESAALRPGFGVKCLFLQCHKHEAFMSEEAEVQHLDN